MNSKRLKKSEQTNTSNIGITTKHIEEYPRIDTPVVSYIGSRLELARNYLACIPGTNFRNFDWNILYQSSYPFCIIPNNHVYNNICCKLVKTQVAKNKTVLNSIKWFKDCRRFTVTANNGELYVLNSDKIIIEDIKRLPETSGSLTTSTWLHDGSVFLVGDWGGNIHLTGPTLSPIGMLTNLEGHSIIGIRGSPTSCKIIGAASDAYPIIWDVFTETNERTLSCKVVDFSIFIIHKVSGYDITSVDWHPTQALIATGYKSNQLVFWDPRVGNILNTIMAHKGSLLNLRFSPCGNFVATVGKDSTLLIWDVKTMTYIKEVRLSNLIKGRITQILWHPIYKSQIISLSDSNGNIHFFDLSLNDNIMNPFSSQITYHLCTKFNAHDNVISDIDYHPLGHFLCSVGADSKIKLWGIPNKYTE